jgi:hypothetical protein
MLTIKFEANQKSPGSTSRAFDIIFKNNSTGDRTII